MLPPGREQLPADAGRPVDACRSKGGFAGPPASKARANVSTAPAFFPAYVAAAAAALLSARGGRRMRRKIVFGEAAAGEGSREGEIGRRSGSFGMFRGDSGGIFNFNGIERASGVIGRGRY